MGRCSWVEKRSEKWVSVPRDQCLRGSSKDEAMRISRSEATCGTGTAWSGGRRIAYNCVNCPVGSENTSASLEGREALTRDTRWPCLKPCQAVVGLKADLRVSTARPGLFFALLFIPSHEVPVESLATQKISSGWFLVSEVERKAWSSFPTLLSELHCPLIRYIWVFTHILPHFLNRISFFGQ